MDLRQPLQPGPARRARQPVACRLVLDQKEKCLTTIGAVFRKIRAPDRVRARCDRIQTTTCPNLPAWFAQADLEVESPRFIPQSQARFRLFPLKISYIEITYESEVLLADGGWTEPQLWSKAITMTRMWREELDKRGDAYIAKVILLLFKGLPTEGGVLQRSKYTIQVKSTPQ